MTNTPFDPETFEINSTALEGVTVVITGTLTQIDRKQAESFVKRAGGIATGSISGKTNLLVAGEKAGSKLQKAEKLEIEILNEEDFLSRVVQKKDNIDLKEETNLDELALKAKSRLDNDPDAIIETDIDEDNRILICRTGVDKDDYRVSLERQTEIEDEEGNFDEECEQISESDSELDSIREMIEYYLEEGGEVDSI